MLNNWIPTADKLPDADMTVLIALSDGEVWTGFLDGYGWHYVSADLVESVEVTHWMSFPAPPSEGASAAAQPRPMKLQIKDAGAWRDVIRFDATREHDARLAGTVLIRCNDNPKATLRTIEGNTVLGYCAAPDGGWRPA